MGPIEELLLFDETNSWLNVFTKIRMDAMMQHDYSLKVSKKPEFKNRNRYGDVSPYDYSRICLIKNNIDYINASLVKYDAAKRAYILTQGPLPGTSGHFWLMIWEQKSRAILMLNRIVEKGHIKCHQYYPTGSDGDDEMVFEEVALKVTFVEELTSNFEFTVRVFHLQNMETSEYVRVMQFHYTAWPDFGVPESPSAFLDFLFAVRSFGVLDDPSRPPVIHCSAGIGRSGTFCLADTCLVLIEKEGNIDNVRVLDVLMEMRKYRMGLIQTHEQLRFSYLAVIEGASRINAGLPENFRNHFGRNNETNYEPDDQNYDDDDSNDEGGAGDDDVNVNSHHNNDNHLPPVPPRSFESLSDKTHPVAPNSSIQADAKKEDQVSHQNGTLPNSSNQESLVTKDDTTKGMNSDPQDVKRRKHDERVKKTRETLERMRMKQQESESAKQNSQFGLLFYGGLSLAVAFLGFAAYKIMSDST